MQHVRSFISSFVSNLYKANSYYWFYLVKGYSSIFYKNLYQKLSHNILGQIAKKSVLDLIATVKLSKTDCANIVGALQNKYIESFCMEETASLYHYSLSPESKKALILERLEERLDEKVINMIRQGIIKGEFVYDSLHIVYTRGRNWLDYQEMVECIKMGLLHIEKLPNFTQNNIVKLRKCLENEEIIRELVKNHGLDFHKFFAFDDLEFEAVIDKIKDDQIINAIKTKVAPAKTLIFVLPHENVLDLISRMEDPSVNSFVKNQKNFDTRLAYLSADDYNLLKDCLDSPIMYALLQNDVVKFSLFCGKTYNENIKERFCRFEDEKIITLFKSHKISASWLLDISEEEYNKFIRFLSDGKNLTSICKLNFSPDCLVSLSEEELRLAGKGMQKIDDDINKLFKLVDHFFTFDDLLYIGAASKYVPAWIACKHVLNNWSEAELYYDFQNDEMQNIFIENPDLIFEYFILGHISFIQYQRQVLQEKISEKEILDVTDSEMEEYVKNNHNQLCYELEQFIEFKEIMAISFYQFVSNQKGCFPEIVEFLSRSLSLKDCYAIATTSSELNKIKQEFFTEMYQDFVEDFQEDVEEGARSSVPIGDMYDNY